MTLDEAIEHARQVSLDKADESLNCDNECAREHWQLAEWLRELRQLRIENAKLCEQVEHLQPTDCEGNVLDIADTVHMLRSEYDGDHEWDDVVVELVLTKWGGDRWIVRGSRGEAWACDCTKHSRSTGRPISATEELRALLDERGVEWEDGGEGLTIIPVQDGVPQAWTVNTWPSGKDMGDCLWVQNRHPLTPAQAVEATIGRGTCRMRETTLPFVSDSHDDGYYMICSECGFAVYMRRIFSPLKYCSHCGRRIVEVDNG